MNKVKPGDFFVLGYFGLESGQLNGQTVKTRSVHRLFEEKTGGKIPYYDTEKLKKSKGSILPALFRIIRTKHLIYMPAQNNLKQFFPLLFVLSKLFRFQIHYFVVGGWLMKFIAEHPTIGEKLKKIAGIYTETEKMKKGLQEEHNMNNVVVFPNFRFFNPQKTITENNKDVLKLVFYSRINKKKGLQFIFDLLAAIKIPVELDFYGPVLNEDREYFESNINRFENAGYRGLVNPEEAQNTLCQYDLLILPTMYYTEGLPGAVVDAYISGIPVLVTDWLHAREFVKYEITGCIVPFENGLNVAIEFICQINSDRFLLKTMKQNALQEALRYSADNAWEIIKENIEI